MIRKQGGFTMVELLITMVVFVLFMAGATQMFTGLLTQFRQQSRIAETKIEGAPGLEILRHDLENAGYGLPWDLNGATYHEAKDDSSCTPSTGWVDRDLDDGIGVPNSTVCRGCASPMDCSTACSQPLNTSNAPGAIRCLNNDSSAFNRSDVLAIKSSIVGMSAASQEWTILGVGNVKDNGRASADSYKDEDRVFQNTDGVIVLQPGNSSTNRHVLATYADPTTGNTVWYTNYNNTANFAPVKLGQTNVIYGIMPRPSSATATLLRMPFNRADYYIRQPNAGMPSRCAPNTGILYKAMLNQSDACHTEYPLLDCVADMEVVYGYANGSGITYTDPDDITGNWTAADIRRLVKEVRVYILAQVGQKDPNYTQSPTTVHVGGSGTGRDFAITAVHYRWKVYTLVVHPGDLE